MRTFTLLLLLSTLLAKTQAFASWNETLDCDAPRPDLEVCRSVLEFYSPSLSTIPTFDDDSDETYVPVYEGGWHWYYTFAQKNNTSGEYDGLAPTVEVHLDDDESTCTVEIGNALCISCSFSYLSGWRGEAQQGYVSADRSNLRGNGYVGRVTGYEATLPFYYPLDLVDPTMAPSFVGGTYAPTETNQPTTSPAPTLEPATLSPTGSPYGDESFCEDIEDQYFTCNRLYGGNQCADACRPYLPDGIGILAFSVPYLISQWPSDGQNFQRAQQHMQEQCGLVPSRTCALDICCNQCSDLFRQFAQCRYQGFLQDFEDELGLEDGEMATPCEIVSHECAYDDTLIPPPTFVPSMEDTLTTFTFPPTTEPLPFDATRCGSIQDEFIQCEIQHGPDCYANAGDCAVVIPNDAGIFGANAERLVNSWPDDDEIRLARAQDYLENACDNLMPPLVCALQVCCPACIQLHRQYLQCRFLEEVEEFEAALNNQQISIQCGIVNYACTAVDVTFNTDAKTSRSVDSSSLSPPKTKEKALDKQDLLSRKEGFHERSEKTKTIYLKLTFRFGFERGQGTKPDGDALAILVADTTSFFQAAFLEDATFGGILVDFSMPITSLRESYADDVLEVDMGAWVEITDGVASSNIQSRQAADVFAKANLNKFVRAVRQNGPRTALFHIRNVHVRAVAGADADLS